MRAVFIKTLLLIFTSALLSACLLQGGGTGAYMGEKKDPCGFAVNTRGWPTHWKKSDFPVVYYIHESVPRPARQNFISATQHWNLVWEEYLLDKGEEPFEFFSIANENLAYKGSPKNDSYNLLIFINRGFTKYHKNTSQAITAIFASYGSGKINDADIIINNESYKYYYDNEYDRQILAEGKKITDHRAIASVSTKGFWLQIGQGVFRWIKFLFRPFFRNKKNERQIASPSKQVPRNLVDFPSLMIHELGHVPGLGHSVNNTPFAQQGGHKFFRTIASKRESSNKGRNRSSTRRINTVMETGLAAGRVRRNIGQYDLDNLFCGYFKD